MMAHPDPEVGQANMLADRLQTLGQEGSQYGSTFAGVDLVDGRVDVYVVPLHDSAFLRAVAAADPGRVPYTIKFVKRGWTTLLAVRDWVTARLSRLEGQGVRLSGWGPDVTANAVQVTFRAPGARQLAELHRAVSALRSGGHHLLGPAEALVTRSTYARLALAVVNAEAPVAGGIIADSAFQQLGRMTNGSADTSPFWGGDNIWYEVGNYDSCTSAFGTFNPNISGKVYTMTPAHCSYVETALATGHTWYTCATKANGKCSYGVGNVNKMYWNNNEDMELIGPAPGKSLEGNVWINQTDYWWAITGEADPALDSLLTVDGWRTGAVPDSTVTQLDGCQNLQFGIQGITPYWGTHTVCNLITIVKNGAGPCTDGDSGGPVVVRLGSSGAADAAAIIEGAHFVNGVVTECWAQPISYVLDLTGLDLTLGP